MNAATGGPAPGRGGEQLIPLSEARRFVLDAVGVLAAQHVDSSKALGSVTAEAVTAPYDLPSFTNSSMDGYAVRTSDTVSGAPVTLQVVDEIMAGTMPRVPLHAGEAAKIMTGAPVPAGADAVVQVEHTRSDGPGVVTLLEVVEFGTNVRQPGDDVAAGDIVFVGGTRLEPLHLGVLASLGIPRVTVHRAPGWGCSRRATR